MFLVRFDKFKRSNRLCPRPRKSHEKNQLDIHVQVSENTSNTPFVYINSISIARSRTVFTHCDNRTASVIDGAKPTLRRDFVFYFLKTFRKSACFSTGTCANRHSKNVSAEKKKKSDGPSHIVVIDDLSISARNDLAGHVHA